MAERPPEIRAVLTRVIAYIDAMEAAVCGEWCDNTWPDCTAERHEAGRKLAADLAVTVDYLKELVASSDRMLARQKDE